MLAFSSVEAIVGIKLLSLIETSVAKFPSIFETLYTVLGEFTVVSGNSTVPIVVYLLAVISVSSCCSCGTVPINHI